MTEHSAEEWPSIWYRRQHEAPWVIKVSNETLDDDSSQPVEIEENLEANTPLSIRVYPLGFQPKDYRQQVYTIQRAPICIVREELSYLSANRLTTALSIIRSMQGLSFSNGLYFITHVFLMYVDWQKAKKQQQSVFSPLNWDNVEIDDAEMKLNRLFYESLSSVEKMLTFWHAGGGRWSAGFSFDPDDRQLVPNYTMIPPKEFTNDDGSTNNVALKDESIQSALFELRDEFLGNNSYRQEGEYWVIVFDWKIIRLKNTKGLRYIAHLLSKPNHLVRVLDLAAMENKQRIDYDYNHSNMNSEQLGMEGLRKSDLSDPDMKRGQRNASDP